jgi:hypothetical protein
LGVSKCTDKDEFVFDASEAERVPHRKPAFQRATEWVREIVLEPFTKAFPDDANIQAVTEPIKITELTSSGRANLSISRT